MRHPLLHFVLALGLVAGSCRPKGSETAEHNMRADNFRLKRENDSLRREIARLTTSPEGDTVMTEPTPVPIEGNSPTLPGKHNLTLQWISWDRPGSVTISEPAGGWFTIKGRQNGDKGNYLTIDGRIRAISDRELEFDGRIVSQVDFINGGEPCVRSGKQLFKATGTRKYWRLQNMINCEGGTVTDYIDIYF